MYERDYYYSHFTYLRNKGKEAIINQRRDSPRHFVTGGKKIPSGISLPLRPNHKKLNNWHCATFMSTTKMCRLRPIALSFRIVGMTLCQGLLRYFMDEQSYYPPPFLPVLCWMNKAWGWNDTREGVREDIQVGFTEMARVGWSAGQLVSSLPSLQWLTQLLVHVGNSQSILFLLHTVHKKPAQWSNQGFLSGQQNVEDTNKL